MIHLLIASALASGTYHPDDIAAQSEAFARAAEAAPVYEDAEAASRMVSSSLATYQQNLDLLGERAPAAEKERLTALWTAYGREQAELEGFAGALMEDFDMVFTAAMERAAAAYPDAVMCERSVRKRGLPGMPGKEEPNPDCQGEDLSPTIAAAMDADAALATQIDELLARTWPGITAPSDAVSPIGGEGPWYTVDGVFERGAKAQLKAIDRADDDARLPIAAALEEGADPASQLEAARAVTAATAAARAALAAPVLAAIDKASAKREKKGQPAIAWCANPMSLGGCTGEPAGAAATDALIADKKVAKALP